SVRKCSGRCVRWVVREAGSDGCVRSLAHRTLSARGRSTLHKGVARLEVRSMKMMARVVLVSIAAIAVAAFVQPGSAFADPPPTQAIAVMAVGPAGEAINGYHVLSGPDNV